MNEKYYVEWASGCTIIRANDQQQAERTAARLFGVASGPYRARLAKVDDVNWVAAMGGCEHHEEELCCG